MFKKSTLFVVVSLLAGGCIEPDDFGPEGTYMAETRATVKAASLEYTDAEREPYQLQWHADDAVDLYYAPTKLWTTYARTSPGTDASVAGFSAEQEWEYGRRSHIFYAIAPSRALSETSESDPSGLPFELAETQLVNDGFEKYMISSALAVVKESSGEKHVELELSPALSLLDLELSATSDFVLKTLSLTPVGAGTGKGLTGPYKLDAATTTVNMRTTAGNSVTLDFGEGLTMEKGKLYQARAVVLPAKLAGVNLSVSGSTSTSSLKLSVCEAMDLKPGFSKAAKYQMAQKMAQRTARKPGKNDYTVIDLETTGLHAATDSIVEYGAVRVRDGQPTEEFSALVHLQTPLSAEITQLTGITQSELEGRMDAAAALEAFLEFVGKDALVGYNLQFDLEFLRAACTRNQKPILTNRKIDLLPLARRKVIGVANFKLLTLVRHFGLADRVEHRALPDCRLTQRLYAKLNETGTGCN